jgi:predicted ATP-dependent serine protease
MQGKATGMLCCNCGHNTHTTDNCQWLGQLKCNKYSWFGYVGTECCCQSSKRKNESKSHSGKLLKRVKMEEVHHIAKNSNDDEEEELDKLTGSGGEQN